MPPSTPHARLRRLITVTCACACLVATALAAGLTSDSAGAASSSSTIVTATVLSATSIDASACLTGVANRTDFGAVQPGTSVTSSSDCTVSFGSSNDLAQLNIRQSDSVGRGMWRETTGAYDVAYGNTFADVSAGDDAMQDIYTYLDGRQLVTGTCQSQSCVVRLLANGTVDTSFATSGVARRLLAGTASNMWSSTVLDDGRILSAGSCIVPVTGIDFCIQRSLANGALDTTFAAGAGFVRATATAGSTSDVAYNVIVGADGWYYAAGRCDSPQHMCLLRMSSAGVADTSWGPNGMRHYYDPGSVTMGNVRVEQQADGKFLLTGYCTQVFSTQFDFCTTRVSATGVLDTSYSGDGYAKFDIAGTSADEIPKSAHALPDGRILQWGTCGPSGTQAMCVMRINANGTRDLTYGTAGVTYVSFPGWPIALASSAVIDDDGRMLLAGGCMDAGMTTTIACYTRLQANGALDGSFGTGGTQVGDPPGSPSGIGVVLAAPAGDGAYSLLTQCYSGGVTAVCTARMSSGGTFPNYGTGVNDWSAGTGFFGACLRATNVAPGWSVNASCPATNGTHWNAIPTTDTTLASTTVTGASGTASLRFGLRTATSQAPGAYVAPITFQTVAP